MTGTWPHDSLFHNRLRTQTTRLFWFGVAMVALGLAALVFPMVSTLVATWFVGWILLVAGMFALAGSFSIHGAGPFFGALLLGLLSIGAGLFLLVNPLAGALALTLLLGVLLLLQGAFELSFALEMRPHGMWSGMLISGLLSIALALLIIIGWPGVSLVALGVLLGVNFISSGLSYMFISRALRP